MTQFSDKCKKLLLENGSNVYQLSQTSSLERTTLQRMVTGKRLPHLDFVKNFCRALRISQFEEQELIRLYQIESIGETAYHNEQSIIQLLKRLSVLETNNYQESVAFVDYENILISSNVSQLKHDTRLLLHFVLAKEFALEEPNTVYANIPATYSSFIPALETLYHRFQKKISVTHLIGFRMNASDTSENLDVLTYVLPFFLSDILDYQVFFHYSRATKNERLYQLFPYYIVTTQHVLLLSDDLQSGILLTDPDIVEQYRLEFERISLLSKPLFHRMESIGKAFDLYALPLCDEFHALHFQPCCVKLLSRQTFLDSVKTSLPPDFHAPAEQFWEYTAEELKLPYRAVYSQSGIDEFCRTGKYYGQAGSFLPPSTIPQRIEMLNYYLMQKPFESDLILKSAPLSIPRHLFFELHGTQLLKIIHLEPEKSLDFIIIEESSICEAFYQFFLTLSASDYAYSPAGAESLIRQKIAELEAAEKDIAPITPQKINN